MRVLWICGLPNEVRLNGWRQCLSEQPTPAWSWIMGHLPPEGVELHIMCPVVGLIAPRVDFEYAGVHWHCFRRKRFVHIISYIRFMIVVRMFVRKLRPAVVHGWGGETGFGYFATCCTRRAVVSVQGLLLYFKDLSGEFARRMKQLYGRYLVAREKMSYRRAFARTTESDTSARALKKYYGETSVVIPHPLRSEFYQEAREELRSATPTFIFVGTLYARKGPLDLIKAFSLVRNKDARLIIIGDGGERQRVVDMIAEGNLADRVELKLSCTAEQIVNLMQRAHVFVLPSYGDTGPTALKEALACGLFPICYANSGPYEYISRYCGYLCRTGNVQELGMLMDKAISNLETCQREAGLSALKIKGDLSKSAIWGKLRKLYEEVVK
mgnify:CR=1 FL=1